jgi:hypothetical protein
VNKSLFEQITSNFWLSPKKQSQDHLLPWSFPMRYRYRPSAIANAHTEKAHVFSPMRHNIGDQLSALLLMKSVLSHDPMRYRYR